MKTVITLPLSKAERDAIGAALAECEKADSAARTEYNGIESRAWTKYMKVRNASPQVSEVREAAWVEYGTVRDAAWDERVKVLEAAWAECEKTHGTSPLAAWIFRTFLDDREDEATAVLEALADGATMAGLVSLAEREEWCYAWDEALTNASKLFDIR